jgi:hypothetical protein
MTILLLAAAVALSGSASAGELVFKSGPARAHLVELFSSEGCSSCPPADDWIATLTKSPGLWKEFVPVVFHVTYWDYLGWKDRFGDPASDARQRAYAADWGSSSVYTPGLVLDGREWRAWGGEPPRAEGAAGTLTASVDAGRAAVTFSPAAEAGPYEVYAARLGFGLISEVTAGENSGRRLRHEFVARSLARSAMKKKDGAWTAVVNLPAATGPKPAREGLAVWIVGPDGRPVQAAGGVLP